MPAKSKVSSKAKEAESKSTLASAVYFLVGSYSFSLWTLLVAHYLWFRAFFLLPHADLRSPDAGKQTPSSSSAAQAAAQEPPKTVNERSLHRFYQTNPHERKREEAGGLNSLTPAERQAWVNASLVRRVASKEICLNNKAEREFWKQVNRESPPIRRLDRQKTQADKGGAASAAAGVYDWGRDKNGRDVGEYPLEQFAARAAKQAQLTALEILHRRFLQRRELASAGVTDAATGKLEEISQEDIQEETQRRREMSAIRKELYGDKMGPYATDPEWDDVVPIPAEEPEGALATIAYPEDYAEGK